MSISDAIRRGLLIGGSIVGSALPAPATATEPRIELIERLNATQITLHFNTDPNRTYELQYTDPLICPTGPPTPSATPCAGWSNLFVAPAIPFANHYVVVDSATHPHRFYRLRVTP